MSAPGVDVIVVNHRCPDDLRAFVDSYSKVEFEVPTSLAVVNVDAQERDIVATKDATRDLTALRHYPFATNVGYGFACNFAAARTHREIIALFSADTKLRPGVLSRCRNALLAHPDWGVVGPCQINDEGMFVHAGVFGTNAEPQQRGWRERDEGQYEEVVEAVSVAGSAYFIKRSVWVELTTCPQYRQVDPDSEGAFLTTSQYFEEAWCSYHARAHGHKVFYLGDLRMDHRWHGDSPERAVQQWPASQNFFRQACDAHGIEHD